MTYRSDRHITESLIPVRLFWSILWHGLDDRQSEDGKALLALIGQAERDAVSGLDSKRSEKLIRRSLRINACLVKPFQEAQAHVAKFGLVAYYTLRRLVEAGAVHIADGSALDQVSEALLSDEGTLVEFANIDRVDASAKKQARRMLAALQEEGLFKGVAWE